MSTHHVTIMVCAKGSINLLAQVKVIWPTDLELPGISDPRDVLVVGHDVIDLAIRERRFFPAKNGGHSRVVLVAEPTSRKVTAGDIEKAIGETFAVNS